MAESEETVSFQPNPNLASIACTRRMEPRMNAQPTVIVFALFPGVTQLDFTGPHAVFSRLPGAQVLVASRTGEPIEADGITFAGLRRPADIPRCDVIFFFNDTATTENA